MSEGDFQTEIRGERGYIKVEGDLESEPPGEALRRAFN
jgi:hypothetical protein